MNVPRFSFIRVSVSFLFRLPVSSLYNPQFLTSSYTLQEYLQLMLSRWVTWINPSFEKLEDTNVTLSFKSCLGRVKESVQFRGALKHFITIKNFYGEGLSAPRPTPKLEDHPLSAVRDCLFNIVTATLRTRRTSLRTRHAVVTRGPPNCRFSNNSRLHGSGLTQTELRQKRATMLRLRNGHTVVFWCSTVSNICVQCEDIVSRSGNTSCWDHPLIKLTHEETYVIF